MGCLVRRQNVNTQVRTTGFCITCTTGYAHESGQK